MSGRTRPRPWTQFSGRCAGRTLDTARRRPPGPADLPAWFPAWASQLADLYFSGTTAAFVLHGNTYDLFRIGGDEAARPSTSSGRPQPAQGRYGVLAGILAQQPFGPLSLGVHYELS